MCAQSQRHIGTYLKLSITSSIIYIIMPGTKTSDTTSRHAHNCFIRTERSSIKQAIDRIRLVLYQQVTHIHVVSYRRSLDYKQVEFTAAFCFVTNLSQIIDTWSMLKRDRFARVHSFVGCYHNIWYDRPLIYMYLPMYLIDRGYLSFHIRSCFTGICMTQLWIDHTPCSEWYVVTYMRHIICNFAMYSINVSHNTSFRAIIISYWIDKYVYAMHFSWSMRYKYK